MSEDATLRALEARATPGPWTPDGDKLRATAADALIPDNILVAYYTGHDHRLGLKTVGHAADVEFMAAARPARPARPHPRSSRQVGRAVARGRGRLPRPVGDARSAPRRRASLTNNRKAARTIDGAGGLLRPADHHSVSCSPSSSWSRARSSATSCGSSRARSRSSRARRRGPRGSASGL